MHRSVSKTLILVVGAIAVCGALWYSLAPRKKSISLPEAVELRPFLHAAPPVPVVFTSRTESASFQAAALDAEGFTYPGTVSWTAREGRLRLLDTDGKLYELTWGRALPGGGTLIDVMSPSVSLDGKRILFAGRKAAPDAGRWRIYQVGVDGSDLRPLTGGPDDPGCIALPPLRFAADGSRLFDAGRRRLDYDDIDPIDLGPNGIAFASTRIPDLGRDHCRRATQIWTWPEGAAGPMPLSANRNNDRWPFLLCSDSLVYSLWSRNREAVTEDLSDVRPVSCGGRFATEPTDHWMAARVRANGTEIGYAIKSAEPVWRPRPLFNGRIAFMTPIPGKPDEPNRLRLAQADWGYIRSAPSSLAEGTRFPDQGSAQLFFGPDADADGLELTAGCPSPCPGGAVLFSAAPCGSAPGSFGLYSVSDDWSTSQPIPSLLFDDPAFVDAEPVAVYPRAVDFLPGRSPPLMTGATPPEKLPLVGDREHTGPVGYLENLAVLDAIRNPIPWQSSGHERSDPRRNPLIPPPPNVVAIAFYAAGRDRFDDPELPRVPGKWEKLLVAPLASDGALGAWLPSDPLTPTVLVGLDADGKVAKWKGTARDAAGRTSTYVAYAGDHYSDTRPQGYHYCNGCHAGHTFTWIDSREKLK
jgi:hypothetical protein